MRILAVTKQGQWSSILFGLFIFFFTVMNVLVASGQRGGDTIFDNLALSVPALLAAGSVMMAFMIGALGIWKYHERSALVWLITAIGLLVLIFLTGELISPH